MDSYFGPLLFGFRGRINRARYWMAVLAYTSMMIAVVGLGFFSASTSCFCSSLHSYFSYL
jgi:uncharacterized membrane protein YhaH (DUF805 family)